MNYTGLSFCNLERFYYKLAVEDVLSRAGRVQSLSIPNTTRTLVPTMWMPCISGPMVSTFGCVAPRQSQIIAHADWSVLTWLDHRLVWQDLSDAVIKDNIYRTHTGRFQPYIKGSLVVMFYEYFYLVGIVRGANFAVRFMGWSSFIHFLVNRWDLVISFVLLRQDWVFIILFSLGLPGRNFVFTMYLARRSSIILCSLSR